MDDVEIERLARRDDEARAKILRQHRWDLISLLFGAVGLMVGTGTVAVALVVGHHRGIAAIPEPLSGAYFTEMYHLVAGRLSPTIALNAVLASAGLCATINVALAVEHRVTDGRDLVALSAWRESVSRAAWLVCVGVVGMAAAAWANLDSPQTAGTALGTSLFAAVTAYLVVSIRRHVSAVDQTSRSARAVQQLALLNVWQRALDARGVPQPLGIAGMLNTRVVWSRRTLRRCLVACVWRVLALALVEFGYFAFVAGTVVAVRGLMHAPVDLSWTRNSTLFFLGVTVLAMLVGLVRILAAWSRWDPPSAGRSRRRAHGLLDDSRMVRSRLDVKPRLVAVGWWLMVAGQLWLIQQTAGVIAAVHLAGPVVVVPVGVSTALRVSRRRPDARWAQRAAWPLWGLLELWLQHLRAEANAERQLSGSGSCKDQAQAA